MEAFAKNSIHNTISQLRELWPVLFGDTAIPSTQQFGLWLARFDEETVRDGLAQASVKFQKLEGNMSDEHLGRFASAVMRRIAEDKQNA